MSEELEEAQLAIKVRTAALDRVISEYVRSNTTITGPDLVGVLVDAKKIESFLLTGEVPTD